MNSFFNINRKGKRCLALALAMLTLIWAFVPVYADEQTDGLPSENSESLVFAEAEEQTDGSASYLRAQTIASLVTGGHEPYMGGYGGALFKPNQAMTRAEVAQVIYNLLAAKPAVSASSFSDVKETSWYFKPVQALAQLGVLNGYGGGLFKPNNHITRAEFVKVLSQCFELKTGDIAFADVSEDSWSYPYIVSAGVYGWIDGYADGTFKPNNTLKRCEAVKILNIALGRMDEDFALDRNVQKFEDVPTTHWAFLHITEAADPPDDTSSEEPPSEQSEYVIVTATSGLNLRSGPGSSYSVVTVLSKGAVLTVVDRNSDPWIHVTTDFGAKGYVHKDYVADYSPNAATVTLSASSKTVAQYQTLYLKGTVSPSTTAMVWTSSNEAVATVSNGFVYAKAPGTAVITYANATDAGSASCTVTVTGPEAVRAAYADPNIAAVNETVKLLAVTDTNKSAVKFQVSSGGTGEWETVTYSTESQSSSGLPTNTVRVFTANAVFTTPGIYTVRAYSKTGNTYSSGYAEFQLQITSSNSLTATSYEQRKASTELLNILANYEGYVPTVYPDTLAGGIPTVGYGYVLAVNECFYNNVTKTECMAILAKTVEEDYAPTVNNFRSKYNLKMSQCQFDALTSFIYNCGTGALSQQNGGEPYYGTARVIVNAASLPLTLPVNGTVNISDITVYESADGSSAKLGAITYGSAVTVTDTFVSQTGEIWYQINYNSASGWIRSGGVRLSGTHERDLAYVDPITFGNNLTQWNMAGGNHIAGLYARRVTEARLFSYGDYAGCYHGSPGYSYNPGYDVPSWYS